MLLFNISQQNSPIQSIPKEKTNSSFDRVQSIDLFIIKNDKKQFSASVGVSSDTMQLVSYYFLLFVQETKFRVLRYFLLLISLYFLLISFHFRQA